MRMMRIFKEKILPIIILFIIALIVLSKIIFSSKLIGRYIDFPIVPVTYLLKNNYLMQFFTWWNTVNGGSANLFSQTLIPINSVLYLPLLLNANPWFIARYQMVMSIFLAMSFFYIFSQRILEKFELKKINRTILAIVCATFFALNNYFFCDLIYGSNVQYLSFAFISLFIYSLYSYNNHPSKKYFLLSLASLMFVSSTLQHLVMAYIFLFIISIFWKQFKLLIKLVIIHILMSLYWILPLIYNITFIKSNYLGQSYESSLTQNTPPLLNAIINNDYFGNRNMYLLALGDKFFSDIWIFNAFIILAISFLCVIRINYFKKISEYYKKQIIIFFIIFLCSLFFIKGGHAPLGQVIIYLYRHFPVFNLFRSLQRYIGFYVISISILFLFSGAYLIIRNKRFIYLLVIIILINAMPWWLTLDLGKENLQLHQLPTIGEFNLTKGEETMYELNNLPEDFRILHIPPGLSINFEKTNNNSSSQGGDAGLVWGNKGFFATEAPSLIKKLLNNMEKDMYQDPYFFKNYNHLFAYLNIKYFVERKNVSPIFSENGRNFNLKNIDLAVNNSNNIELFASEDYINIFENKNFLPHFYIPQKIISIKNTDGIEEILNNRGLPLRSAFFSNVESTINNFSNTSIPKITFIRINPTKYKIKVENAKEPYYLIFSENFDKDWKLYFKSNVDKNIFDKIVGSYFNGEIREAQQQNKLFYFDMFETWFQKPIVENKHNLVNSYANAWHIMPENVNFQQDYELIVEYWPQRLFYFGFILFIILFLSFIYFFKKTYYKTK